MPSDPTPRPAADDDGRNGPMNYKHISRQESLGRYRIGVKIEVATPHALSDAEKSEIGNAASALYDTLWRGAERSDPEVTEAVAQEKRGLLALFPADCGHKEISNGYDERSIRPWFAVYTNRGMFVVGWRKRVISLDWSHGLIRETAEELFPNEDVTKSGRMIHAWGYDKAREYVARLLSRKAEVPDAAR